MAAWRDPDPAAHPYLRGGTAPDCPGLADRDYFYWDGKILERGLGGNISPQGPALFNGTLYFANQGGKVYAISATRFINSGLRAPEAPPAQPNPGPVYFKETGHAVGGEMLDYW